MFICIPSIPFQIIVHWYTGSFYDKEFLLEGAHSFLKDFFWGVIGAVIIVTRGKDVADKIRRIGIIDLSKASTQICLFRVSLI